MDELLHKLRERKLVQWALAYVAGAFALLHALDIVAQQFGWPDSVRRGITVALAIGFFVTVVLAWYHGEKGAQRVTSTELVVLAAVLALGGAVLLWATRLRWPETGSEPFPGTGAAVRGNRHPVGSDSDPNGAMNNCEKGGRSQLSRHNYVSPLFPLLVRSVFPRRHLGLPLRRQHHLGGYIESVAGRY